MRTTISYAPGLRGGLASTHRLRPLLLAAGVVALILVGLLIGRWSAPGSTTVAAAGDTQAASASRPLPASSTGPRRVENGVPLGYSHDQAGAVSAAQEFEMVTSSSLVVHPDAYRAARSTMAAPDAVSVVRDETEKTLDNIQQTRGVITSVANGIPAAFHGTALAWHVTSYSPTAATVELFEVGLLADGVNPFEALYVDETVNLEWTAGDWRLASNTASMPTIPVSRQHGTGALVPPEAQGWSWFGEVGQ